MTKRKYSKRPEKYDGLGKNLSEDLIGVSIKEMGEILRKAKRFEIPIYSIQEITEVNNPDISNNLGPRSIKTSADVFQMHEYMGIEHDCD
jgi:hypothetical protein